MVGYSGKKRWPKNLASQKIAEQISADFYRLWKETGKFQTIKKQIIKNQSTRDDVKSIGVFKVCKIDDDGEILCIPDESTDNDVIPEIYVQGKPAPKIGDKILGRISKQSENVYSCTVIKILTNSQKNNYWGF